MSEVLKSTTSSRSWSRILSERAAPSTGAGPVDVEATVSTLVRRLSVH
jgi:hypothetical protein